jgi:hypothetical protein
MMRRRAFLGGTLSTAVVGTSNLPAAAAAQDTADQTRPEPLVWPVVKVQPDIGMFAGHTDTVPDIVGRIGTPPSLAIFTEGNHLMVLLSDDIVGAFPAWAKSQPQYADLDLENVIVVTLPQPVVVQMIRTGGIALGNLTLEVSRRSGFYPDIVMAGPEPLREIRKLGAIEPQARFFSRNRGPALLVRRGNPLGIHALTDIARTGARIALPNAVEAAARARYRSAIEGLIGTAACDALFAAEVPDFPGRLGIVHRDLPEMVARSVHAVPPRFLLDADIPAALRAGTGLGRGTIFREDRPGAGHRSAAGGRGEGIRGVLPQPGKGGLPQIRFRAHA